MPPTAGPWRAVRAAFVAAVCVACSLSAHVLAGGSSPPEAVVGGCWLGVGLVAFRLSGRPLSFGRLLLLLGAGQLVLHPVFDVTGAGAAPSDAVVMAVAHLVTAVVLAAVIAHADGLAVQAAAAACVLLSPLLAPVPSTVGRLPDRGTGRVAASAVDLPALVGMLVAPTAERAPPSLLLSSPAR